MNNKQIFFATLLALAVSAPWSAWATNGMNLEGYGPIALGMGGASFGYDNGLAAVVNNPATLGLAPEGDRLDLAVGFLGPNVNSSLSGQSWGSDGDAYYMPAFGWGRRDGDWTFGIASFAQGGMGTDYSPGPGAAISANLMSSGGTATGAGSPLSATIAAAAGLQERSEVGVGRLILPLVYTPNDQWTVGGTLDYVWASMDLQMAMPGQQMFNMIGSGLISGDMVTALQGAMGAAYVNDIYYGYFDFTDDNDFSGRTRAWGYGANIGATFRANDRLTVGATYHSQTRLKDLHGSATVSMAVSADTGWLGGGMNSGTFTDATFPLKGSITIQDFEWPAIYGVGAAYQVNDRLMVAGDLKRIQWADVMEAFKMSFKASNAPTNGPFAGLTLNATMPQDWDNQTVVQLGVAYQANDQLTLRAGFNGAKNPIPDSTVLYIFPAPVENHYTAGAGYQIADDKAVNGALSFAPEVKATNSISGMEVTHSQFSWQVMYSQTF